MHCTLFSYRTVSREVIDDAQAEHEKELKKEREQRHERVVAELTEEFIHEVVEQQSLNLATIKIRYHQGFPS